MRAQHLRRPHATPALPPWPAGWPGSAQSGHVCPARRTDLRGRAEGDRGALLPPGLDLPRPADSPGVGGSRGGSLGSGWSPGFPSSSHGPHGRKRPQLVQAFLPPPRTQGQGQCGRGRGRCRGAEKLPFSYQLNLRTRWVSGTARTRACVCVCVCVCSVQLCGVALSPAQQPGACSPLAWMALSFGMCVPSTCSAPCLWLCRMSVECVCRLMFLLGKLGYFLWVPSWHYLVSLCTHGLYIWVICCMSDFLLSIFTVLWV